MDKNKDTLLITCPANIRYLTGFVGVDKRDSYLLLIQAKKYLLTTSLYLEAAKNLKDVIVVEISKEKPIEKEVAKLTDRIEFEENDLTVGEYNKLKKFIKKLIPTKNRIEKMRMIKRPDEIENIRAAAKLTDQCFTYILRRIRPGVTERRLAWEIESYIRYRGAECAFSPIVAFDKNSSQPHYQPGSDLRRPQGLTLLDIGARVNGYCADMTRVVFMGKPKDEWVKAYKAVLEAQQKALDLLRSGERNGATLDKQARKVIEKANLPGYQHSLGHNVGLDIHETPRLTVKKDAALRPGMVFSIEPAIYIQGQYGIRIEDLVLLKRNSIEVLSKSSKEIVIL